MSLPAWKQWKEDGWTDWMLISDREKVPSNAGVYVIAAKHEISRAVGIDEHGILDIGESNNLQERIDAFIGCIEGRREKGHMAGWRYRVCNFNKVFPLQELHICWKECTDKAEAQRLEGQLLSEYLELHYELPPLNYKFNWSE